ncbi:hypothetical protein TSOC_002873 [Tetrabaena socialis]|uniref:Uncharacterized protein n=1 Tax=Tetrabaena socialis TaxID=47790 RepID=A0A2J8AD23_9CHLO|nr:hypothetical protein TSOC_002873 [Tetrabaena socialis]|eukprot:PNH10413.1 hypothetical protein TSOC_002873 [Tetrabaena socialis]
MKLAPAAGQAPSILFFTSRAYPLCQRLGGDVRQRPRWAGLRAASGGFGRRGAMGSRAPALQGFGCAGLCPL